MCASVLTLNGVNRSVNLFATLYVGESMALTINLIGIAILNGTPTEAESSH